MMEAQKVNVTAEAERPTLFDKFVKTLQHAAGHFCLAGAH